LGLREDSFGAGEGGQSEEKLEPRVRVYKIGGSLTRLFVKHKKKRKKIKRQACRKCFFVQKK